MACREGAQQPTGDAGTTSTTGESATTTSSTSTSSGTIDDTSDATGSPREFDGGGRGDECDTFTQDCGPGLKCAPWANGGGSNWNATKCVPVTGDQMPGEPCTAEGSGVTGLDDCIKGALCWDVDAENHGVCVAQCVGSIEEPACAEPGFGCALSAEGVLTLCLATCDPLMQDCPEAEVCLPVFNSYLCIEAWGDGLGVFEVCEFSNVCDAGLVCLEPAAASECDQGAQGCCLPLCSIAAGGDTCPGVGQQCLPVYEPQAPGFEEVGFCSLPP